MEEAIIKQELEKPVFKGEIEAKIKTLGEIEDNIQTVKEYALNLKEYYSGIVFTEETKKDAEEQKAEVNKQKKQVADFRKQIIAKYNEPIKLFEETAKETEKLLGDTYEFINEQVKKFDLAELEKVKEKVEKYFEEYKLSKDIDFIKFDDLNINITKGLLTSTGNLTKKVQDQITDFVDSVRKNLDLIQTLEFKEEILVEYKKTLKCADSIAEVQDRHRQLEELEKQKKEEPLTDDKVQEKISYVSAPKAEEKVYSMTFTVKGTMTRLKELKEYLLKEGFIDE